MKKHHDRETSLFGDQHMGINGARDQRDQDVGGGRGVCCQGLSEVEVHSMEDILEVVRRAQVPWNGYGVSH